MSQIADSSASGRPCSSTYSRAPPARAQRLALEEHGLTLVSTQMGRSQHEYVLLARDPAGEHRLIDEDGGVHPYVDSRADAAG